MGTSFPEPDDRAIAVLLCDIEDVFSDAFRRDPDLAADVADAMVTRVPCGSVAPWIVVVTHLPTNTVISANSYTDARIAIRACRDVETETGGASKATLLPAAPLTIREIDAEFPDAGEAP